MVVFDLPVVCPAPCLQGSVESGPRRKIETHTFSLSLYYYYYCCWCCCYCCYYYYHHRHYYVLPVRPTIQSTISHILSNSSGKFSFISVQRSKWASRVWLCNSHLQWWSFFIFHLSVVLTTLALDISDLIADDGQYNL